MSNINKKNSIGCTALLIIDAQAKIINPIKNKELILNNIYKVLKAYEILGENIYLSEQNPLKLGRTIDKLLPKKIFKVIEKVNFSIANSEELNYDLSNKKIKKLIICGFETHICIQQSVLNLLKRNFEISIIVDAMGSRNMNDHNIAIKRMMWEGAKIESSESIIFELCETSDRDEFKSISSIIKNK
tara:strand:+ start:6 stop:566 length:561 start_codon:yes stop_codon:yes gene_type:complete